MNDGNYWGNMMAAFVHALKLLRYAGYGLCVAWGFLLFAVSEFQTGSSFASFSFSTVPGFVACAFVLILTNRMHIRGRRTGLVFCCAVVSSVGTFLCVSDAMPPVVRAVGLVVGGAFFVGILISWFSAYAKLTSRDVLISCGSALALASLACIVVSVCPRDTAGLCAAVLPVASTLMLPSVPPHSEGKHLGGRIHMGECTQRGWIAVAKAAVPTKTLLGIFFIYFVIDSLRVIGRLPGSFFGRGDASFLVVPMLVSIVCVAASQLAHKRVDLGVACKLMLAAFFISLALVVTVAHSGYRISFAISMCSPVLCWMLLVFVAKKSPVTSAAVFAIGWMVEFIGGLTAQFSMSYLAELGLVLPFILILAMAAATVFVFSDEKLIVDIDCDGTIAKSGECTRALSNCPASHCAGENLADLHGRFFDGAGASGQPVRGFSELHGFTAREEEVFALWVAGRDMRTIQEELFISQGTVKTHLRNIYDKCGVHSRRDLIKMYEQWMDADGSAACG